MRRKQSKCKARLTQRNKDLRICVIDNFHNHPAKSGKRKSAVKPSLPPAESDDIPVDGIE